MEVLFVFNNIAQCEEMTEGFPTVYILADKMSLTWINFAKKGDSNH